MQLNHLYYNNRLYYPVTAVLTLFREKIYKKMDRDDMYDIVKNTMNIKPIKDYRGITLMPKEEIDWWFMYPTRIERLKQAYDYIEERHFIAGLSDKERKDLEDMYARNKEAMLKRIEAEQKAEEEKENRPKEEDMDYVSRYLLWKDDVFYK